MVAQSELASLDGISFCICILVYNKLLKFSKIQKSLFKTFPLGETGPEI